jgi:hypothetical protein
MPDLQRLPLRLGVSGVLACGLLAASVWSTPREIHAPLMDANKTSFNWSGYVLTAKRGAVQGIYGSWIVQSVPRTTGNTYSAQWIGIDGTYSRSLIQIGTDSNSLGGSPFYMAWTEALPQAPILLVDMDIYPGDVMRASILKGAQNWWTMRISDVTRDESYSVTVRYRTPGRSAEWIEERPVLGPGLLPTLAHFGVARFGRLYTHSVSDGVVLDSPLEGRDAPEVLPIDMTTDHGRLLSQARPLAADGSSFEVARV